MIEEIAPKGESSPHTNALTTSALISWPNTQDVKEKTASRNVQPRPAIVLFMDCETLCRRLLVIDGHFLSLTLVQPTGKMTSTRRVPAVVNSQNLAPPVRPLLVSLRDGVGWYSPASGELCRTLAGRKSLPSARFNSRTDQWHRMV